MRGADYGEKLPRNSPAGQEHIFRDCGGALWCGEPIAVCGF